MAISPEEENCLAKVNTRLDLVLAQAKERDKGSFSLYEDVKAIGVLRIVYEKENLDNYMSVVMAAEEARRTLLAERYPADTAFTRAAHEAEHAKAILSAGSPVISMRFEMDEGRQLMGVVSPPSELDPTILGQVAVAPLDIEEGDIKLAAKSAGRWDEIRPNFRLIRDHIRAINCFGGNPFRECKQEGDLYGQFLKNVWTGLSSRSENASNDEPRYPANWRPDTDWQQLD